MLLFIQLLLAHIIGDFFLQWNKWVKNKEQRKWKSRFLYFHVLIHFLLILVITLDIHQWKLALCLSMLHFIIDGCKLSFQRPATKRAWFFIDQGLHLATILVACLLMANGRIDWKWLSDPALLALVTGMLFLLNPASFIIKMIISKWIPKLSGQPSRSLENAGQWIGMMERLLIFVFILIGKWEGVGFLMAAKSIFRFGDLKDAKDMQLTEYVLIGTLLSFGLAIGVGLAASRMWL